MADVYRIGVSIAMRNGVSSALKVIQKDVLGLAAAVDFTQGKFDKLKLAVVGAGAAYAGKKIVGAWWDIAKAGGGLLDQQQRMIANGTTQADLAKEMAKAYQMTAISGSDVVENLRMVADLRQIFGQNNLGEALTLAPNLMKAGIAAGNLTGQDPEKQAYLIAQAAERLGYTTNSKGEIDPARLGQFGNLVDAIISATNGRVDANSINSFAQMASAGGRVVSLQGLMDMVPIIQTFGGFKAGTMLTAFQKAFAGGVMTQRGASWLEGLGLLNSKNVKKGESGYAQIQTSMLAGYSTMLDDPQAWANQYLKPALDKAGISPQQMLKNLAAANGIKASGSVQDELKTILKSGLANTNVRYLADLVANSTINGKEVENVKTAAGTNQYDAMMQSLTGAEGNFKTAWEGLMSTLGLPAAKNAVMILNSISTSIRNLTQWLGSHPAFAAVIDKTLLALGVGLTALGAALAIGAVLAAVGTGGTLAALGIGIAAVAGVLMATNWSSISKAFGLAITSIENDIGRLLYDLTHPGQLIKDIGTSLNPPSLPPPPTARGSGHWVAAGRGARRWIPDAGSSVSSDPSLANDPAQGGVAADKLAAALWNFILKNGPDGAGGGSIPVVITNPGAIARGIHQGITAPNSGPTGFNQSAGYPGTPALAGAQ